MSKNTFVFFLLDETELKKNSSVEKPESASVDMLLQSRHTLSDPPAVVDSKGSISACNNESKENKEEKIDEETRDRWLPTIIIFSLYTITINFLSQYDH